MSLPFFITIFIVLIYIVLFMDKKLSFTTNSIQFMVLSIISTNYLTVMTNKLEWIRASRDVTQFISLLINRECILPLVGVVMVNRYLNSDSVIHKSILFISLLFFITSLDLLHLHFKTIDYPQWSLLNTVIMNSVYLIISIGLGKALYALQKKEVKKGGQNL
ncbi:hypothetical protein LS684_23465 (plasmid) [Cytobacillus spongiae]|uniref:hypothetical protein n=1 Tax=Cytobacillus spongiae TaxID=2901381 RepID=UPI001F3EFAD7|nr:hypothetical protein [Cytobacillus spongiae]UII58549.1 hypothetical protein LS684_23465 [Cytobacillus spongiae]